MMSENQLRMVIEFDKYMLKTISAQALKRLKDSEPNVYHEEFMRFVWRIDNDMRGGA